MMQWAGTAAAAYPVILLACCLASVSAAGGLRGHGLELRHSSSKSLKPWMHRGRPDHRSELRLAQVHAAVASERLDSQRGSNLLTPLPNDTISAAYWAQAESLLASAAESTEPPPNYNHMWSSPTPKPYKRLHKKEQPWDTFIGSSIMASFEQKPTQSPAPSQQWVSQTFVAQCPFLQFGDMVYINGPKCGQKGTWTDPATGRVLLRFDRLSDGSIDFNVDSAVNGNGSIDFAYLDNVFAPTSKTTPFQLKNCMGTNRYTIEERMTKVTKMGSGTSTATQHDTAAVGPAFFATWHINSANGSTVAGSPMVRINQNQVNLTYALDEDGESLAGGLFAIATRAGDWTRRDWRTCDNATRRWQVQFVQTERDFETAGTVMDLRIASMAMITLMAVRDETRDPDTGLTSYGQAMSTFKFVLYCLFAIALIALVAYLAYLFVKKRIPDRLYKYISRIEAATMPKRPFKPYMPAMPNSW